jgi:7-alpha-hydroxysteroid dehydrogenase
MDSFRLDGKVAVVTGGGRGIGRAMALALADAGADVAIAARRTNEIEAVAEEIRAKGRKAAAITADLMESENIDRLADETVKQLGRVDVWVNNAAGGDERVMRTLSDTPETQWDPFMTLTLKSVWLASVAAAKRMTDGGSIINITSIVANNPSPYNGPYAAAKAGVNSLTMTLARELAPNIRVNGLAPGPVPTEFLMQAMNLTEDALPAMAEAMQIPLKRMGAEEDFGPAIVYLASPASSWVTGQVLTVSGGL